MTIETVESSIRHWLSRLVASPGGKHWEACRRKLAGMIRRKRYLKRVREGVDMALAFEVPVIENANEEAPEPVNLCGPPEDQDLNPDQQDMDILAMLRAEHEREVAEETEELRREYCRRAASPSIVIGPGFSYILELIARLRCGLVAEAADRMTDKFEGTDVERCPYEPEAEPMTTPTERDPILEFLCYMEEYLENDENVALDLDEALEKLHAAKEAIRGQLLERLEEQEDVQDLRERAAEPTEALYPGHCEAEAELNRLAREVAERYSQCLLDGETVVESVIRLLDLWGRQPKLPSTWLDQVEKVEQVSPQALRDVRGKIYIRLIGDEGKPSVAERFTVIGNLLEAVELALAHPEIVFVEDFAPKQLEKARGELRKLGEILLG